jgi:heme/copper-type cytochrome/quinol oxidase subunit 2
MFAIIGVIIKMFFSNDYSVDGLSGPANTNIWGYGVISFSLLGLLFVTYSLTYQKDQKDQKDKVNFNSISFLQELFNYSIPSFLLLFILFWLIMLNITYYTPINKGNVSSEFVNYSFVSSFVILIQLFVVYKFIREKFNNHNNNKQNTMAHSYKLLSYLLTLSNIILIGIMTIILKYYSTDG